MILLPLPNEQRQHFFRRAGSTRNSAPAVRRNATGAITPFNDK